MNFLRSLLRPVHHTFAPLGDRAQCMMAVNLLFQPWRWHDGAERHSLITELSQRFGGEAFLCGSGREALLALLLSLRPQENDEVIVQGYTCVVVANAVIAAGMKPIFADIDPQTLNLDIKEVERLITPRTRAIICQHTFGIPADTATLRALCDMHRMILIEDCAHILPDATGPDTIGERGDALICSFGRDKAISGIAGGALVCKNPHLSAAVRTLLCNASAMPSGRILRLLFYPLLYAVARPLYGIGVGKLLLAIAARVRLFVPIVSASEKGGSMNTSLSRMPNACAILALHQWRQLQRMNDHRRNLTRLYCEEAAQLGLPRLRGIHEDLPLQKFPFFFPRAEFMRRALQRQNIHLHDGWTGCVICPASVDASCVGYRDGEDPSADCAGEQILSLPTHPGITQADARRAIRALHASIRYDTPA